MEPSYQGAIWVQLPTYPPNLGEGIIMREHEKDFTMAIVFNSINGINVYTGCLMKKDEKYIDPNIEIAYNAFSAALKKVERQLKRYKPDRFIAECILREAGVTEEQFRNVLKQAGDSPIA